MSKRAPPSSKSNSPSKKRKTTGVKSQSGTIESFFKRSPQKATLDPSAQASSSKTTFEILDDDEEFARKLASEEGIDIETVRQLELGWKSTSFSSPGPSSSKVKLASDSNELASPPSTGIGSGSALTVITDSPKLNISAVKGENGNALHHRQPLVASIDVRSYPDLSFDSLQFSLDDLNWPEHISTPYSFLAHVLNSVAGTRSRLAILNIITNALRIIIHHDPTSLLHALYLLSNSLSPPYIPIELGLGPSIISKAIQNVSGLSPAALKRLYTRTGDAGDVAFEAKSNVRTIIPHPPLTVNGVYESLLKICRAKGDGATKVKQSIVERLLVAAKGEETRYLVRTLGQHIRVGAVRTTILTALARALVLTRPPYQAPPPDDSPCFASKELVSLVNKDKSDIKKKKPDEDPARKEVFAKLATAESILKKVYVQHPNYDHIVTALLEAGLERLQDLVQVAVGTPLHPTLGSPTRSLDEIYERLNDLPFAAEFKYDGQRAQIHAVKFDDQSQRRIKIFSRHLEDMTDKYPDIVALVGEVYDRENDLTSFVMDAEIVAINPSDGALKTFQELSNRARKDVQLHDIKVSVCVFAFDLMYYNGTVLLEEPFRSRRQKLREKFPPLIPSSSAIARFAHVESCESVEGRDAVEEFWQRTIESRSEGLMVKLLDSGEVLDETDTTRSKPRRKPLPATYEPDKRTMAWLKLKKDYVSGLGDSLDLVPIGAWHGNGRKAAWWSPILLAVWDDKAGQLIAVCKCMSGFRDEFYIALNERYPEDSATCSKTSSWNVNLGGFRPEVYFKPQEVWEIRGADITLSPVSVAAFGLVTEARGLSLRFPRFIRVRDDKGAHVDEASSPEFVADMWRSQQGKGKIKDTAGNDDGDLMDFSEESEQEVDEYE